MAHPFSVSGPKMGLSVFSVMTVEKRTDISFGMVLIGVCGELISV